VGVLCYSFVLFSPLVYGMEGGQGYARESNSSLHHLHWLGTWEF
jgi:dolichyl-phosphate-mannose--protein O-mannosyl transferase